MRLFVAIELDRHIRSQLATVQQDLKTDCNGVRWVKPDLLHLTVKFLGEVADGDVRDVSDALASAARHCTGFDLDLECCGCFPPRGAVRIVWAGAPESTEALLHCVELVESELERKVFPREQKRFAPHITLGRVRFDRSGGAIRSAVDAYALRRATQPVGSLTLMSSVLSPKGPTYTPVGTFSF